MRSQLYRKSYRQQRKGGTVEKEVCVRENPIGGLSSAKKSPLKKHIEIILHSFTSYIQDYTHTYTHIYTQLQLKVMTLKESRADTRWVGGKKGKREVLLGYNFKNKNNYTK